LPFSRIYRAMVSLTSSVDETPAALMRLAADGDEIAFARIVDAHHADMSSVCFVVTGGNVELTEEAVQSAWPIVWRKLGTIRDPERLRPWLISIAVNEARQLARRRRRGRVLEISVARDGSATTMDPDAHAGDRPAQRPRSTVSFGPGFDRASLRRRVRLQGARPRHSHEPVWHPRSTGPITGPPSIGAWRWMR
jgi:DNA-directed RNA polymerase specialized sigma24 family protein